MNRFEAIRAYAAMINILNGMKSLPTKIEESKGSSYVELLDEYIDVMRGTDNANIAQIADEIHSLLHSTSNPADPMRPIMVKAKGAWVRSCQTYSSSVLSKKKIRLMNHIAEVSIPRMNDVMLQYREAYGVR